MLMVRLTDKLLGSPGQPSCPDEETARLRKEFIYCAFSPANPLSISGHARVLVDPLGTPRYCHTRRVGISTIKLSTYRVPTDSSQFQWDKALET